MIGATTSTSSDTRSVLDLINERLAGIDPSKVAATGGKRPRGVEPAGNLNDHQRRLFGLVTQLADEHNALATEFKDVRAQITEVVSREKLSETLRAMMDGALDESVVERYEQLKDELTKKKKLYDLVSRIFWLDVKTTNQKLLDAKIAIFSDWTLGISETHRNPLGEMVDGQVHIFRI